MLDWTRLRPAVTIAHLLDVGASMGVAPELLLANVDLTVEDVHDVGRKVMGLEEVAVVRSLVNELPRAEHLGMLSALRSHTTSYGPVGFAWASAPTMRAVYECGRRFHALTFGMTEIDFKFSPTTYTKMFTVNTLPSDVVDFYHQREISLPIVVAREISDLPIVAQATLPQQPFTDPEAYALADKLFGARPTFNAEFASFTLPLEFLDTPLPRHNPHTHNQMVALAEIDQERVLTGSKVTEAVRLKVSRRLSDGARLEDVAQEMLLSPRSLRRYLQEEGTTYRNIVDAVRVSRAEHLLSTGSSVAQASVALGYENPSAFTAAFKRWHGIPPSKFMADRIA